SICSWLEQAHVSDATHLLSRLRLLNQVAQAAAGSLDRERILTVVLRELDRHIPLQAGAVWLIEEAEAEVSGTGSDLAGFRGRAQQPIDQKSSPSERTPPPGCGTGFDLSAASLILATASACSTDNTNA